MMSASSSTQLKVPYGLQTSTGRMVHVDKVPNGRNCDCTCPSCDTRLIARQGTEKIHHFAHANSQGGCEGALHATGKLLLFQRIQDAIQAKTQIPIRWNCTLCQCNHEGDLLKRVDDAFLEKQIPGSNIRPDVYLSKVETPYKLLEIVHTHSPDKAVYDYVEANGLILLLFNLKEALEKGTVDEALEVLRSGVLEPDVFNLKVCQCELCPHCDSERICNEYHRYCETCQACVNEQKHKHGHCLFCSAVENRSRWKPQPHKCLHCSQHFCSEDYHYCKMCLTCVRKVPGIVHSYCVTCQACVSDAKNHEHCKVCGKAIRGPHLRCSNSLVGFGVTEHEEDDAVDVENLADIKSLMEEPPFGTRA